ncbi:MAG: rod shape-determining protein MreD [Candidatus Nanopelagicales bacterium]|nr:rod shape-determining protein MreD [Candidatus Nanopelagicales bacterium]
MWLRQLLILTVTLLIAITTQNAFLSRLGLPGATPDLVLVSVIAVAMAYGASMGMIYGFAAGILLDFAPSTAGVIGVNALLFMAAALAAARAVDPRDRTVPIMIALVAGITAGVILARGVLDSVLGHPTVVWGSMAELLLTGALYSAILAPIVVMPLGLVVKKFTPEVAV